MSHEMPGERERRSAELAKRLREVDPSELTEQDVRQLVSWAERNRFDGARALSLWQAAVRLKCEDSLFGRVAALLAAKDLVRLEREVAAAARKPAMRTRVIEALKEAAQQTEGSLARRLDDLAIDLQASSPQEAQVLRLTVDLEIVDARPVRAAAKAIAAWKKPARLSKDVQRGFCDALGSFAAPHLAKELAAIGRALPKLSLRGLFLERALAQCIPGAMLAKDQPTLDLLLPMVPRQITWDPLAYNLSCHAALTGDKPRLLELVKTALALGRDPRRFLEDTDFTAFWKDADFLALVQAKKKK